MSLPPLSVRAPSPSPSVASRRSTRRSPVRASAEPVPQIEYPRELPSVDEDTSMQMDVTEDFASPPPARKSPSKRKASSRAGSEPPQTPLRRSQRQAEKSKAAPTIAEEEDAHLPGHFHEEATPRASPRKKSKPSPEKGDQPHKDTQKIKRLEQGTKEPSRAK